jgi:hypothetical protein
MGRWPRAASFADKRSDDRVDRLRKVGAHTFRRVRKDGALGESIVFEMGPDGKPIRYVPQQSIRATRVTLRFSARHLERTWALLVRTDGSNTPQWRLGLWRLGCNPIRVTARRAKRMTSRG